MFEDEPDWHADLDRQTRNVRRIAIGLGLLWLVAVVNGLWLVLR